MEVKRKEITQTKNAHNEDNWQQQLRHKRQITEDRKRTKNGNSPKYRDKKKRSIRLK